MKELITNVEVGQVVDVSECNNLFLSIEFTWEDDDDGEELGYSYRVKSKGQPWRNIYPWQNSQERKFWKTLNGAKRHFMKMHG